MFYAPPHEASGLPFNPFKSCCVPRPIGWLSTVAPDGTHNLAPYSQFQNVTWDPPTVMVAANARADGSLKDTTANILATREFVWSMATYAQREWVVTSSRDLPPQVDEFEVFGIPWLPSRLVRPRRVKGAPVHFECRLTQQMAVPGATPEAAAWILVAQVVGIHIEDGALTPEGLLDTVRLQPLARLGYRDYTCVERVFELSEFSGRAAADVSHLKETPRA